MSLHRLAARSLGPVLQLLSGPGVMIGSLYSGSGYMDLSKMPVPLTWQFAQQDRCRRRARFNTLLYQS